MSELITLVIDFVISPIEFAYQGLLYASFRFPSCHGLYTRLTLGSCIHDFPLMSCNIYGFEDICRLSVSLDAVSRKAIQCIIILRDVRMAPRLSFSVYSFEYPVPFPQTIVIGAS